MLTDPAVPVTVPAEVRPAPSIPGTCPQGRVTAVPSLQHKPWHTELEGGTGSEMIKEGSSVTPSSDVCPEMTRTFCQLIRPGFICEFLSWRNLVELKCWTKTRSSEPSVHSATSSDRPKDKFAGGWQCCFQHCLSPAWSILTGLTSICCFVFQRGTRALNKSSPPALRASS